MRATLILSRADGAIIQSSGLSTLSSQPESSASPGATADGPPGSSINAEAVRNHGTVEEIARMIFDLVNAAGSFATGLAAAGESGDEARRSGPLLENAADDEKMGPEATARAVEDFQLLRVSMRRGEAEIVPGKLISSLIGPVGTNANARYEHLRVTVRAFIEGARS